MLFVYSEWVPYNLKHNTNITTICYTRSIEDAYFPRPLTILGVDCFGQIGQIYPSYRIKSTSISKRITTEYIIILILYFLVSSAGLLAFFRSLDILIAGNNLLIKERPTQDISTQGPADC